MINERVCNFFREGQIFLLNFINMSTPTEFLVQVLWIMAEVI